MYSIVYCLQKIDGTISTNGHSLSFVPLCSLHMFYPYRVQQAATHQTWRFQHPHLHICLAMTIRARQMATQTLISQVTQAVSKIGCRQRVLPSLLPSSGSQTTLTVLSQLSAISSLAHSSMSSSEKKLQILWFTVQLILQLLLHPLPGLPILLLPALISTPYYLSILRHLLLTHRIQPVLLQEQSTPVLLSL